MTVQIDIGEMAGSKRAGLDLEELLATRLLVQGNSGSGKSHLLRRILEQSAPWVQQAIIDAATTTNRYADHRATALRERLSSWLGVPVDQGVRLAPGAVGEPLQFLCVGRRPPRPQPACELDIAAGSPERGH